MHIDQENPKNTNTGRARYKEGKIINNRGTGLSDMVIG
jgi:hypothetical protein